MQLPGAAPRGAYEALIARLGGEREIWAFAELVGRLAEVLYLEDVRAGGWLLDLGLWGSPVYLAAARDLILGCDGRVLRCMLPPDG